MKRLAVFALILSILFSISCKTASPGTGAVTTIYDDDTDIGTSVTNGTEPAKILESITDISHGRELVDEEEPFYEDERYIYIFGNPVSEYITVKYSDGSTENVREALENGHVAITDLDIYGINYFAESKLVQDIIDRTETEHLFTLDVLEEFWHDDEYTYYFGSSKSHYIIVRYIDGTEEAVKDALVSGRITLADLDRFGIGYGKRPRVYVTNITDRDTMDTAMDVFFTGMEYYYYFPSIHETTVYYSDGTRQSLKEAMADFRVTAEDLDKFGILYSKAPLKKVAEMDYREGVLTAIGTFWSDLVYDYYFPYCDTEVTVIFTDGTKMELTEALKFGFVSVADLDRFGIGYGKKPRVYVTNITDRDTMDTTMDR